MTKASYTGAFFIQKIGIGTMVLKNQSIQEKIILWKKVHHFCIIIIIASIAVLSVGLAVAYEKINSLDVKITNESELIQSYYKCLNDIKSNTNENKENLIKIRDGIARIKKD